MIVIDIEASGTNYEKHSIVSLGVLEFERPKNQMYLECRIFEGAHIMDEALGVNGFSKKEITDSSKMSEEELVRNFFDWTKDIPDRTLAGQNVSFDRDFLKAACLRSNREWTLAHRTLDTHTLCYMHMLKAGLTPPLNAEHKRSALNLDAILNYCGIPKEPKPHNALTGAKSHAEVISRLLYGKKLLPEFQEFEVPEGFV